MGFRNAQSGALDLRIVKLLILALLLLAPAAVAEAHPHIWIRASATLQFENGKIVGIQHEWVFDDFFSSALIGDFDKNKNKQFDPDEVKELEANAFVALKDFGYFTHVKVGGKEVPIASTRDFAPSIKDGRVIYRFTAVLRQPVDPKAVSFAAGVYDDSYYVDVELNPQNGVKLAGLGSEACKFAVVDDKQAPLYFGATFARQIELTCGKD
jgi:ABC-type uncharacterized transport system substrate-binding protein